MLPVAREQRRRKGHPLPESDNNHRSRKIHHGSKRLNGKMTQPDFDTDNLPKGIRASMIAYGYLTPDLRLTPNYRTNKWHNVLKDHPPLYKPYGMTPRYANLFSGEHDVLCQPCQQQRVMLYEVASHRRPVVWDCICRAAKPSYFRGNSRPYLINGNPTAYWEDLDIRYIITDVMPPPLPNQYWRNEKKEEEKPKEANNKKTGTRTYKPAPPNYWAQLFSWSLIMHLSGSEAAPSNRSVRQAFVQDKPEGTFTIPEPDIPPPAERARMPIPEVILSVVLTAMSFYATYIIYKWAKKAYLRCRHNNITIGKLNNGEYIHGNQYQVYASQDLKKDDEEPPPNSFGLCAIHTVDNTYSHNSVENKKAPWVMITVGTVPYKGIKVRAILDTATDETVLSNAMFQHIKGREHIKTQPVPHLTLVAANNKTMTVLFSVHLYMTFLDPVNFHCLSQKFKCLVTQADLSEDFFIGANVINSKITIFQNDCFLVMSANPNLKRKINITPGTEIIRLPIGHGSTEEEEEASNDSPFCPADTSDSSEERTDSDMAEEVKEERRKIRRERQEIMREYAADLGFAEEEKTAPSTSTASAEAVMAARVAEARGQAEAVWRAFEKPRRKIRIIEHGNDGIKVLQGHPVEVTKRAQPGAALEAAKRKILPRVKIIEHGNHGRRVLEGHPLPESDEETAAASPATTTRRAAAYDDLAAKERRQKLSRRAAQSSSSTE